MKERQIFDISEFEAIRCDMDEQETSITMLRNSDQVKIYTSDNKMLTKLSKIFSKNKDNWTCFECGRDSAGKVTGYLFITNKKAISFRTGKGKNISEEARQKRRERFKKFHNK